MKTMFTKIGILMTLIFSFFFSVIATNNKVSAIGGNVETGVDYVEITSIQVDGRKVTFTTKEAKVIYKVMYELVFVNKDGDNEADLITIDNSVITTSDNKSFSFVVNRDFVGIRIHRIQYRRSSDTDKPMNTASGSREWGDLNSIKQKNYIYISSDDLQEYEYCSSSLAKNTSHCMSFYTLFFNLDTVDVKEIIDISFSYAVKTYEDTHVIKNESDVNTYTYDNVKVINNVDYGYNIDYVRDYLSDGKNVSSLQWKLLFADQDEGISALLDAGILNKSPIGLNKNGNGYKYYLSPLNFTTYSEEGWWGATYYNEELQEVSIITMSYYTTEGYKMEDIPVLDYDTGWVAWEPDDDPFSKLIEIVDWIVANFWKILIGIVCGGLIIMGVIKFGLSAILKLIWLVIKYTIGLPFVLIGNLLDKREEKKKFIKGIQKYNKEKDKKNSKHKNVKKHKK